jgi:putative PIN family toxin of toxin-antitoxin system
MRVVVDTNVFVSAAFRTSSRSASVIRWIDRHGGLLKSTATEAQLIEVLRRPYIARKLPPDYQQWVNRLLSTAELVMITERIVQCRDPTDDKFLELAVNGRSCQMIGDATWSMIFITSSCKSCSRASRLPTGLVPSLAEQSGRRRRQLDVGKTCPFKFARSDICESK